MFGSELNWTCTLCDTPRDTKKEIRCVLCQQNTDHLGLMVTVTNEIAQKLRIVQVKGEASTSSSESSESKSNSQQRFAHAFCMRLVDHPESTRRSDLTKLKCAVCDRKSARLQCGDCQTVFHPDCALKTVHILTHNEKGEIRVRCSRHRPQMNGGIMNHQSAAPSPKVKLEPKESAPPMTIQPTTRVSLPPRVSHAVPLPPSITSTSSLSSRPVYSVSVSSGPLIPVHPQTQLYTQQLQSALQQPPIDIPAINNAPTKIASSSRGERAIKAAATATQTANAAKSVATSTPASSSSLSISQKDQFKRTLDQQRSSTPTLPSSKPSPSVRSSSDSIDLTSPAKPKKQSAVTAPVQPPPPPPATSRIASNSVSKLIGTSKHVKPTEKTHVAPASKKRSLPEQESEEEEEDDDDSTRRVKKKSKPTSPTKKSKAPSASSSSSSSSAPPKKRKLQRPPSPSSSDSDDDDDSDTLRVGRFETEDNEKLQQEKALKQIAQVRAEEKEVDSEACVVCGSEEEEFHPPDEDGNNMDDRLVFCEGKGCKSWYHQACYGIDHIPKGDFFCWPCKNKRKRGEVVCVICDSNEWRGFCEVKYGPGHKFAHTNNKKSLKHFAHIDCVFWTPVTNFEDPSLRNPCIDIENIPRASFKLACQLCPHAEGAKLQCQHKECVNAFHPLCMIRNQSTMYFDDHLWDEDTPDQLRPPKEFYCRFHSKKHLLLREKKELEEAGEPTAIVEDQLAELERVVLTTSLPPAEKLVSVVPPSSNGTRGKRRKPSYDLTDQIHRKEEFEQHKHDVQHMASEQLALVGGIDTKVEDIDSDNSSVSRKRLKRMNELRPDSKRRKLDVTTSSSSSNNIGAKPILQIRQSVRQHLTDAIFEFTHDSKAADKAADQIEQAMYEFFGHADSTPYRHKARDLISNFKVNPDLISSLLRGELPPSQLVRMSDIELAPSDLQELRMSEAKEDIHARTAPKIHTFIKPGGQIVTIDISKGRAIQTNGDHEETSNDQPNEDEMKQ